MTCELLRPRLVRPMIKFPASSHVVKYCVAVLRRGGQLPPLVIGDDYMVLDGNHRFTALRQTRCPSWAIMVKYNKAKWWDHRFWRYLGVTVVRCHGGMDATNKVWRRSRRT